MTWITIGKWVWRLLPIVMVVGLFAYCIFVVIPANTKLKTELDTAKAEFAELEDRFAKYEENVGKMNGNISGQITIRTQQEQVRGRINDIDVKIEDQPYLDDGLRARAGVMRDYQKTSPVFDSNR